MITEDLIVYIQAQLRKNISKDIIISRLINAGWHSDDVNEAFLKITPPVAPIIRSQPQVIPTQAPASSAQTPSINIEKKEGPDLYRESIVSDEPKDIIQESWAPKTIPVVKSPIINTPENPVLEKPIFSQSFKEANKFVPTNQSVDSVVKKVIPQQNMSETKLEVRSEELMPSLIPKATPPIINQPPKIVEKPSPVSNFKVVSTPMSDMQVLSDMPNNAVLHSYQRALINANKQNQNPSQINKRKFIKWLLIIVIISAMLGSAFAISRSNIKLPSFNLSFIKKDPKTILANAPLNLDGLKAYKIETTASVNLPSFADITSGLISGEAVSSQDTDSLSLTAQGLVNNESGSNPIFDYKAKFHSSLFKNDITTELKYNNLISLITTPDLSELLGPNSPKISDVIVPKGEFSSFIALLPESLIQKAKKVDIDKLISIGVPSYVNKENSSIFKDFVNKANLVEKPEETIRGTLSYHYEISADRATTKKFLNQFVNIFLMNLSDEEKSIIDERLGATTIDSFEVWIGKDDSKIHQYSFILKTPLSRLIGLEDKGIAGNTVSLSWKTTYYDFDIHNEISTPTEVMTTADFMKYINDMKIKDKISSFKQLASDLRNAIGKYGKSSNPTGSCTNPSPSSLFSPIGHTKGAGNAVGNIASLIKDVLNTTGGALSCYSTPTAWAISAPLASNPTASFCADSTGTQMVLTDTSLSGVVCK